MLLFPHIILMTIFLLFDKILMLRALSILVKDLLGFIYIALGILVRVLIVLDRARLGNCSIIWVNAGALWEEVSY